MKLKFYACDGPDGSDPRVVHFTGIKHEKQLAQYMGREYDPETREHRATKDGVDLDTDVPHQADDAARAVKMVRRERALWPADQATAVVCGVEFVPVTFKDGKWLPQGKPKTTEPSSGKG